eukprot:3893831-Prymnesium_polylepis.1
MARQPKVDAVVRVELRSRQCDKHGDVRRDGAQTREDAAMNSPDADAPRCHPSPMVMTGTAFVRRKECSSASRVSSRRRSPADRIGSGTGLPACDSDDSALLVVIRTALTLSSWV